MLKTALKPRWILALILALVIAAVFVLLSQWQFSSSRDAPPPSTASTEQVQPLTSTFEPGIAMTQAVADQLVHMEGTFVQDTRVLVQTRLQGERNGLWVVSAFEVDSTDTVIPVVHGWIPDAAAAEDVPLMEGAAVVMGRLLPTEAPEAQRPVPGQVPTLSVAELTNLWDAPAYAGFVVSFETTVDDALVEPQAPLEAVNVGPQPQETPINWLNIFYAAEWVVFAGFAFFLWWRLVADDHRRTQEDQEDDDEPEHPIPAQQTSTQESTEVRP